MDFEFDIKKEFLEEAKELLELAEEAFLEFEKNPTEATNIDNIFRLFHTLKGSSFTAGFDDFGKFTHKVENLLSSLKKGDMTADTICCDYLLKSNDVLKDWVLALEDDVDSDFSSPLVDEIQEYISSLNLLTSKSEANNSSAVSFGFFEDDIDIKLSTEIKQEQQDDSSKIVPLKKASNHHKPKILIVDDEPDIQEILEMYLEDLNADIIKADDGQSGLKQVHESNPDIILSDLRMPHMNGIEFIEQVREFNKNIPVLFISGAADREDIISFIKLGALNFIEKPVSREILLTQVRNGLYIKMVRENFNMMTMHNFQVHMIAHQLFRVKNENTRSSLEKQLKTKLDQISELNNRILEIKLLDIA